MDHRFSEFAQPASRHGRAFDLLGGGRSRPTSDSGRLQNAKFSISPDEIQSIKAWVFKAALQLNRQDALPQIKRHSPFAKIEQSLALGQSPEAGTCQQFSVHFDKTGGATPQIAVRVSTFKRTQDRAFATLNSMLTITRAPSWLWAKDAIMSGNDEVGTEGLGTVK